MTTVKTAARAAQDSPVFRTISRIGYVVLGIPHIVIGVIAILIATGAAAGDADQNGAMERIREAPAGAFLLWVIVIGLSALAVWQVAEALLEDDPDTKKKWGYRVKFAGTAIAYLAIAGTALVYALGGQSDSSESSESFSAQLMATPVGLAAVGLIGLIVLAIGVAFIVRGFTRAFEKHLDLPSGRARTGIVTFGVVGYVSKGIAVAVAGVLFIVAAFTHDPATTGGLDDALRALAELPFGSVILWVVGAGLVIYGIFCFARARYARM
jgi:hypothetical protein